MSIINNINAKSIWNLGHFFYVKTALNIFTQNYGRKLSLAPHFSKFSVFLKQLFSETPIEFNFILTKLYLRVQGDIYSLYQLLPCVPFLYHLFRVMG